MGGWLRFGFDSMERRGRDLSAEVTVRIINLPGFPKDALTPSNLNLASISGRDSLKGELERVFGQTLDWPQQVNKAISLVGEAWFGYSPMVDLYDTEETELEYLIGSDAHGFAPLDASMVLFGDGGVSKTNVGIDGLIHVAYGRPWHGMATIQMPVLMVDAEANQGTIRNLASRRLKAPALEWVASLLARRRTVSSGSGGGNSTPGPRPRDRLHPLRLSDLAVQRRAREGRPGEDLLPGFAVHRHQFGQHRPRHE